MDRTTAYRLALQQLGEYDCAPGTPAQKACDKAWDIVLRDACARYNWTFLKKAELLPSVEHEAYNAMGYDLFPRPLDCVKLISFRGSDDIETPKLVAEGILVETGLAPDGLTVEYQSDLTAGRGMLPDQAPLFVQGVVFLLAATICVNLTSQPQLAQQLRQQAEQYFWEAITHDRQQDWSAAQSPDSLLKRMQRRRGCRHC